MIDRPSRSDRSQPLGERQSPSSASTHTAHEQTAPGSFSACMQIAEERWKHGQVTACVAALNDAVSQETGSDIDAIRRHELHARCATVLGNRQEFLDHCAQSISGANALLSDKDALLWRCLLTRAGGGLFLIWSPELALADSKIILSNLSELDSSQHEFLAEAHCIAALCEIEFAYYFHDKGSQEKLNLSLSESLGHAQDAIRLSQSAQGDPALRAFALHVLGSVHNTQRALTPDSNPNAAENARIRFEEAFAILQAKYGTDHYLLAEVLTSLAREQERLEQDSLALATWKDAFSSSIKTIGENAALSLHAAERLTQLHEKLGLDDRGTPWRDLLSRARGAGPQHE